MARPTVFVGSSTEALDVARAFHSALDKLVDAEITVWDQGAFRPSEYTMDALIEWSQRADFAVLVASPDDHTTKRGETQFSPRDNVLLELGLFMGGLGRSRVFVLPPRDVRISLPSDLLGITHLQGYRADRSDGNLVAELSPGALEAARVIIETGVRTRSAPGPSSSGVALRGLRPARENDAESLQEELDVLGRNAEAQGWRVRRTSTAVRLTDRRGVRATFAIPRDPTAGRVNLRAYVAALRARGLRVNGRLREPLD